MKATIKAGQTLTEVNEKGFVIGKFKFESFTKANFAFVGKRNVLEVNGRYFTRAI